jgi:hypothetical protein
MNVIVLDFGMHQVFSKIEELLGYVFRIVTNDIIEEVLDYIFFVNIVFNANAVNEGFNFGYFFLLG